MQSLADPRWPRLRLFTFQAQLHVKLHDAFSPLGADAFPRNLLRMPRVSSYTPSWLSRPSAGFDLFALPAGAKPASGASAAVHGPRKTIAQRGTELFVAVENEIRWTDLVWLKESSPDAQNDLYNRNGQQAEPAYRASDCPVFQS